MTPVDHRERAFEDTIEAHLLEHGWLEVDPVGFDRDLGLHPDELLAFVEASQHDSWVQLVERHGSPETARQRLLARVAGEIDKRGTIDVLRHGVNEVGVKFALMNPRPASGINPDAADAYALNRCGVSRQLKFEVHTEESLDLALLVNGVPTATAELKNPLTGQTVAHARRQYQQDRNAMNTTLGRRAVVHFAVDPDEAYMTTRLANQHTRFLPFNRGSAPDGRGGKGNYAEPGLDYRTAYLWRDVWQRDSWLDLLARFVHVDPTDKQRVIFPRYHQWAVVNGLLADARERGAGRSYLIQHSAGSGKSNSIAWLSYGLSNLHGATDEPVFNKVVVITDRVVLDKQLQDTIYQFEHQHGLVRRITGSSQELLDALSGHEARIIITTIQKFPVVLGKLQDGADGPLAGRRYAVIVDEAHSSQSGETARALKQVLGDGVKDPDTQPWPDLGVQGEEASLEAAAEQQQEREAVAAAEGVDSTADAIAAVLAARGQQANMSFFAFTATPKPRTLELFGERDATGTLIGPFHLYSMRQAIEEGFILDVLAGYTTYDTYYKLQQTGPRKGSGEETEVERRKVAAKLARFVTLHPHHLGQRAEIIVEHFREHVRHRLKGKAKAMVVTASRLHAVRCKQAIDDYIATKGYTDLHSLVAFSGSLHDPDTHQDVTEAQLNGFPEKELPARFATDAYQVLIVAEKYQTGFDQPLLVAMYVDKKLANVNAVQTLSRLNRMYQGKDRTFVLDFVNDADDIKAAFDPFYEATIAEPTDPNVLFDTADRLWPFDVLRIEEVEAFAQTYFVGQGSADHKKLYALTDPARERFLSLDDEQQGDFRDALTSFVRAYSFLSQIVAWIGPEQEQLYAFTSMLLKRLPSTATSGDDVDLGAIELTHYRVAKHSEQAIQLDGDTEPGIAMPGAGLGRQTDEPLDTLQEIIRRFNERFGTDFTDADKLIIEHAIAREMENDETRQQARANDLEGFQIALNQRRRFQEIWLQTAEASQSFFEHLMKDGDMRAYVENVVAREVWERSRESNA